MTRCQVGQLDAPAGKKGIRGDKNRVWAFTRDCGESRIDCSSSADVKDLDSQSDCARSQLHVLQCRLGRCCVSRIDQHGDARGFRQQLA
jgi:hypothetical protein